MRFNWLAAFARSLPQWNFFHFPWLVKLDVIWTRDPTNCFFSFASPQNAFIRSRSFWDFYLLQKKLFNSPSESNESLGFSFRSQIESFPRSVKRFEHIASTTKGKGKKTVKRSFWRGFQKNVGYVFPWVISVCPFA